MEHMAKLIGFSEATYIAMHCMTLVALNSGKHLSIREMAEKLGVSEAHLAKVILRLSRTGLLRTTRGPGGGAVLAKEPERISFLDVVEAIEGPVDGVSCVFGHEACVYGECVFGDFLTRITESAKEWLSAHNMAEFTAKASAAKDDKESEV